MAEKYWFSGKCLAMYSPIWNSLGRQPDPEPDDEEDECIEPDPRGAAADEEYDDYLDRHVFKVM